MTIAGLQDRATERFADEPMVLTAQRRMTYRQVQQESRRLASGLIAAGLRPSEHVALIMANLPEFVLVKLAIARAGAVCVPVNFLLRNQELAYVLRQSDSRFLITMAAFRGHDYLADLAAIHHELPDLREVVVLPDEGGAAAGGSLTLETLAALATPESDAELARREAAADGHAMSDIIYTSGTTGSPKGVMLTHDMVLRAAYSSALTRSFETGRRIQYAMPMYHVFGYVECWIASMFVGGAVIPHAVFDPSEMLDWAERFAASDIVCVPPMTGRLIDAARQRGHAPAFHAVFNSGGVNVPTIWQEIRDVLGAKEIHTAYGMTETTASAVCTLTEDPESRLLTSNGGPKIAGSAGDPALAGRVSEYRVVDPETGAILPPGSDGELQVRGPIVTAGYYRKPDETRDAFTPDGWLRTGDIGKLSADGYVALTGRIKESYRCGGEMVMPREIELLFEDYPGIAQALAVGVPDAKMGEVGCLCLVPGAGVQPDDRELLDLCARRLARFKVPRHVLWLEPGDIPLTVTGRPQKFRLAQLAARLIEERQEDVH